MINRSAGQGAGHAGTAETWDVNGADDSARGEEDHVCGAGTRAVLDMGAAQSGRPDWTICRDKEMIKWSFRVAGNDASQRGKLQKMLRRGARRCGSRDITRRKIEKIWDRRRLLGG